MKEKEMLIKGDDIRLIQIALEHLMEADTSNFTEEEIKRLSELNEEASEKQ